MKTTKPVGKTTKKRYEPPRIRSRESIEAVAAICPTTKASAADPSCQPGPFSS